MIRAGRGWLLLLVLALAPPALAEALPVDDSGSQVLDSTLKLRWDDRVPVAGRSTLSGTTTVLVRLDLRPWRGRQGRIYHRLPAQPATSVLATWTTQGVLLPGRMRDGERSLVYAGPIDSDVLQDTFRLTVQANGDQMEGQPRLRFEFEIELESP